MSYILLTTILLLCPALLIFGIVGAINRRYSEVRDIADELERADMYCFLRMSDIVAYESLPTTMPVAKLPAVRRIV